MDFLALNFIIFVRILLTLLLDIPLSQSDFHLLNGMVVHAMSRRHYPVLIDQSSSAGDSLGPEQTMLDQGGSPGMMTKAGVVTSHNARLASCARVHLATARVSHRAQVWVDIVHLVSVHAAAPDHAAIAEVHGLLAAKHAGGGQVTVVLVTSVPE